MKYSSTIISAILMFSFCTVDASLSLHRPSFSKKALVLMCDIPLYCTTQFFDYWIGSKNSFHKIRALLGYATDQRLPLAPFARNNNSTFLTNQLALEPYIQNDVNIAPQVLDHAYFKSQTNLSEPQLLMLLDKSSHAQTDIVQKIIANEPHLLASLKETLPKHHLQIIFDASIKKIEEKHYKPSDIEYDNLALLLNKNVVTSNWIKECYRHPWNYTLSTNQENRCESLENLFSNDQLIRLFLKQREEIRDEFGLLALKYLVKQEQFLPTHVTALEIINKSMRHSNHRDIKKVYKEYAYVFFDLFTRSFNKDLKKLSNSSVRYFQRLLDYGVLAHKWPNALLKSLDAQPNYTAIRNLLGNKKIIKALLGYDKKTSCKFDSYNNYTTSSLTAQLLIKYAVCHCNDHDKNPESPFETYNISKHIGALLNDHIVYRKLKSKVLRDDECCIQKMVCRQAPCGSEEIVDNMDRYKQLEKFFKANGTSMKYHKVIPALLGLQAFEDEQELFIFALNQVDFTTIFAKKLGHALFSHKKHIVTFCIDQLIEVFKKRRYAWDQWERDRFTLFLKEFINIGMGSKYFFKHPDVLVNLITQCMKPNKDFFTEILKRYVQEIYELRKDYDTCLIDTLFRFGADCTQALALAKSGEYFANWLGNQEGLLRQFKAGYDYYKFVAQEDISFDQNALSNYKISQYIKVFNTYKQAKFHILRDHSNENQYRLLQSDQELPDEIVDLIKEYAFDRKDYKLLKECIAKRPDTWCVLSKYDIERILQNNDRQMLEIMCTDKCMAQRLLKVIIKKNIIKSPAIFQEALLKLGSMYDAVSSQLIENFCMHGLYNEAKFEHVKAIFCFEKLPLSNILKKCCFWAAKNNNFERILPLVMIYAHRNKKSKQLGLSKNYTKRLCMAYDDLYPAALKMLYRTVLPESSHQRMTFDLQKLDALLRNNSTAAPLFDPVPLDVLSQTETDENLQDSDSNNNDSESFPETTERDDSESAELFLDNSKNDKESAVVETMAEKQIVTGVLEKPRFYLHEKELGYQSYLNENEKNHFALQTTLRSKL